MATLSKAFYEKGGVVLVQPLGSSVRLGSVGYLNQEQWLELTTVKKMFGIDLSIAPGTSNPSDFDAKSGKKLKFETHLQGEASALVPKVANAKARAEITFGSEGSFVMSVKNQTVSQAQELGELLAAIRYAYRHRKTLPEGKGWEKNYAVIIGLASADSVAVLASHSRSATAIITGSATVAAPATPADLDASMSVSYSQDSVDKLWRSPATGYAFQALAINPSLFTAWDKEDIELLKPRGLAHAQASMAPKRGQARAYQDWAVNSTLEVGLDAARLLGPTGKAVTALPPAPRAKPGMRRKASGNRPSSKR